MCGLNPCMSAVNPPIGRGGGPPEFPVVRHGVLRIGRHWFSSSSVRRSVFPRPDRAIGDGPAAMRAV